MRVAQRAMSTPTRIATATAAVNPAPWLGLAFTEMVDRWYAQMLTLPRSKVARLIRLGARISKLLPPGKRT